MLCSVMGKNVSPGPPIPEIDSLPSNSTSDPFAPKVATGAEGWMLPL